MVLRREHIAARKSAVLGKSTVSSMARSERMAGTRGRPQFKPAIASA
jgi:hypothetical protein